MSGYSEKSARDYANEVGINLTIKQDYSNNTPEGQIISQNPNAQVEVKKKMIMLPLQYPKARNHHMNLVLVLVQAHNQITIKSLPNLSKLITKKRYCS